MMEKYTICSRQSHAHQFCCNITPVWWKVVEAYCRALVWKVSYSRVLITYKSGVVITLPAAAWGGRRIVLLRNTGYTPDSFESWVPQWGGPGHAKSHPIKSLPTYTLLQSVSIGWLNFFEYLIRPLILKPRISSFWEKIQCFFLSIHRLKVNGHPKLFGYHHS